MLSRRFDANCEHRRGSLEILLLTSMFTQGRVQRGGGVGLGG